MDANREKIYSELRERASNTPLALICQDRRSNSILGKLESEQRLGVCFAAALELAKNAVNSTIVFICYDQAKRYDLIKAA